MDARLDYHHKFVSLGENLWFIVIVIFLNESKRLLEHITTLNVLAIHDQSLSNQQNNIGKLFCS